MAKSSLLYVRAHTARAITEVLRSPVPLSNREIYRHQGTTVAARPVPFEVIWRDDLSSFVVYIPDVGSIADDGGAVDLSKVTPALNANDWYLVRPDATDITKGHVWCIVYPGKTASDPRMIDLVLTAPNVLPIVPDSETPLAMFRIAAVETVIDESGRAADLHLISPLVIGAVTFGGGGPSKSYAPGFPEIIKEGLNYFEVYYFGEITVADGKPKMVKLNPPVEAYRVQVVTHAADHTNGVVNGPL